MITNPTPAQVKQVTSDILAAAGLDTLPPSRTHGALVRKLQKKFTLGRGAVPSTLSSIVDEWLLYDFFDRAYNVSLAVGQVDAATWDVDYNYIRTIIHHTAYIAHRQGFLAEAAALEPLLRIPAHYQPTPLLMSGERMRLPFEKWDLWNAQPADMTSTIAGEAMMDLARLSTMWLFGGSAEWPRERIDALYDSTVEQIKRLPGWDKW